MSTTPRGVKKKLGASKFFLAFDTCFECLVKMDRCLIKNSLNFVNTVIKLTLQIYNSTET
jgi:hypothetical protein